MASEEYDFAEVFQAVFIPKQRPPPDPLPEGTVMASISTYPPLGQVTQLKTSNVAFVAVLEVGESHANSPWEAALWHSAPAGQSEAWVEHPLSPSDPDQVPSNLQAVSSGSRLHFYGQLSIESALKFTVKFRSGSDQPWRWIRDEAGMGDGAIIINDNLDQKDTKSELPDLIKGLNPEFKWKTVMSQCPGTRLWSIEAAVEAAKGEESKIIDVPLGVPWGSFLR